MSFSLLLIFQPSTPAATPGKPAAINRVSHRTRLALARAYSRTDDKKAEAREKYEEVIKMAPEVKSLKHNRRCFLTRFEEPKWSLKIVQRFFKFCFYNSVESCVLLYKLRNGFSRQTLKKYTQITDGRLC